MLRCDVSALRRLAKQDSWKRRQADTLAMIWQRSKGDAAMGTSAPEEPSQSSSIESGSSMCARKSESSMSHLTTGGTRKPRKSRFHADAYHARILSGSPLRTHLTLNWPSVGDHHRSPCI